MINLRAIPGVRLRLGGTWVEARATALPEDDVRARVASFSRNPVVRRVIIATFVALETRPMTVCVDLA